MFKALQWHIYFVVICVFICAVMRPTTLLQRNGSTLRWTHTVQRIEIRLRKFKFKF